MSVSEIFDDIDSKLYPNLASPLRDVIGRDNRAYGSMIELQNLEFSNKTRIVPLVGSGIAVQNGTLETTLVTQSITAKNAGTPIDFNNSSVQRIAFGDPTSSTDPVNKRTLDAEVAVLNSSIDKINNYLLILSATYIIRDQNGVIIKF
jgi:hypothetical protein